MLVAAAISLTDVAGLWYAISRFTHRNISNSHKCQAVGLGEQLAVLNTAVVACSALGLFVIAFLMLLVVAHDICSGLGVGLGCVHEFLVCAGSLPVLPVTGGLSVQQHHAAHSYITPTPAYLPDAVTQQWTGQ
jgi:hypothetical protein